MRVGLILQAPSTLLTYAAIHIFADLIKSSLLSHNASTYQIATVL
jgi:hypothetical protein